MREKVESGKFDGPPPAVVINEWPRAEYLKIKRRKKQAGVLCVDAFTIECRIYILIRCFLIKDVKLRVFLTFKLVNNLSDSSNQVLAAEPLWLIIMVVC